MKFAELSKKVNLSESKTDTAMQFLREEMQLGLNCF